MAQVLLAGPCEGSGRGSTSAVVSFVAVWRWVFLRFLRDAALNSLGAMTLLGVPLFRRLLPASESGLGLSLSWILPAGLLGTSVGLSTLCRGTPFLVRLDPRTRFLGELGALLTAAAYLQCPILLGALLSGVLPSDLGRSLPAILTADLHLAGIALLLLLPTLSTALRVSFFLSAVWLVPALLAPDNHLASIVALLDPGAAFRSAALIPSTLATAVALPLAARLLRTGH